MLYLSDRHQCCHWGWAFIWDTVGLWCASGICYGLGIILPLYWPSWCCYQEARTRLSFLHWQFPALPVHSASLGLVGSAVAGIKSCMQELWIWLHSHFLKCNNNKTEVLVTGSWSQTPKVHILQMMVGDSAVCPVDSVNNLAAIFGSRMTMMVHVTAAWGPATFHLRNIGKIRHYLTPEACEGLVHTLVPCRLDLNNALLVGLPIVSGHQDPALPEYCSVHCHLPEDLPYHTHP